MQKKIVLIGGTFDPIHLGHTTVALASAASIGAEIIVFIPAKQSPLKQNTPIASDIDRLKMITLATSEIKNCLINDYELKKTSPSYTIDTIRYLQNQYGSTVSLYWLIGSDSLDELPDWDNITSLIDECNLATMYRAGFKKPDFGQYEPLWGWERTQKLQKNIIKTPLIDISSTEIRNRISTGKDVSEMLHPAVAEYIFKHRLYESKSEGNNT